MPECCCGLSPLREHCLRNSSSALLESMLLVGRNCVTTRAPQPGSDPVGACRRVMLPKRAVYWRGCNMCATDLEPHAGCSWRCHWFGVTLGAVYILLYHMCMLRLPCMFVASLNVCSGLYQQCRTKKGISGCLLCTKT